MLHLIRKSGYATGITFYPPRLWVDLYHIDKPYIFEGEEVLLLLSLLLQKHLHFISGFTHWFPLPSSKRLLCVTRVCALRGHSERVLSQWQQSSIPSLLTAGAIILALQISFPAHINYVSFFPSTLLFLQEKTNTHQHDHHHKRKRFSFWVKQNWILLRQRNTDIVNAQCVSYAQRWWCYRTKEQRPAGRTQIPKKLGIVTNRDSWNILRLKGHFLQRANTVSSLPCKHEWFLV